ncbi:MAG: hypothetical protein II207_07030 [Clostridia bacterium]|nr:hypothetical protein [Clostridia bacterium]
MRSIEITQPEAGRVEYPDALAFMYSRQPVIIQCGSTANYDVAVTVTCETSSAAAYTEKRRMHKGRAEFDISRIMQTLSRELDTLLQRIDYTKSVSTAEVFSLTVRVGSKIVLDLQDGIQAMHGALDAGELYGIKPLTRRLFLNYPQTINMWEDSRGDFRIQLGGESFTPDAGEQGAKCKEVNFMQAITGDALAKLQSGVTVSGTTTWWLAVRDGSASAMQKRSITLVPDNTPRKCGAYLRWLNRYGGISYWLFDRETLETASSVRETFARHYEGNPAAPVQGTYMNPEKRNYEETRTQTISASNLSKDEHDELCSLLTSPLVEMLEDSATETKWYRVNVEAGSLSQKNKRNTPKLYEFEAALTLPKRNVARL